MCSVTAARTRVAPKGGCGWGAGSIFARLAEGSPPTAAAHARLALSPALAAELGVRHCASSAAFCPCKHSPHISVCLLDQTFARLHSMPFICAQGTQAKWNLTLEAATGIDREIKYTGDPIAANRVPAWTHKTRQRVGKMRNQT